MELASTTDPKLLDVLTELRRREPIFHRPELGTRRADFENMTAEDFWEVGASGRRYSRQYVLDVLEEQLAHRSSDRAASEGIPSGDGLAHGSSNRAASEGIPSGDGLAHGSSGHETPLEDTWDTTDFRCQELAADVYLLTYTLRQQGARITRRSTIWRRATDGWKIVFHQGTVVANP